MNAPARLDPLSELRAAGLTVALDAGRLIITPASTLADAHRQILRDRRSFIVAALKAEGDELARLVRQCGDAYGFTEEEHAEVLAASQRDPVAALECFRSIADEYGEQRYNQTPREDQDCGKVSHERQQT